MGSNPINLAVRFLLELSALIAMGMWGWKLSDNWTRFIFVIIIPVIAMAIWGTFAVVDDPSRSGQAPVPIPGIVRLLIELAFFSFAVWTLKDLGYEKLSLWMGIIVIVHYAISYDRIIWLLSR
ncbi:MAG: DUF2568 domain-containing protein [Bacteroidetes bacterium]|nr:MAG: DUF2568 domain-containing protein [Bacteroidota bacterium]